MINKLHLSLLTSLILTGCSDPDLPGLEQQLQQLRLQAVPEITALPEILPVTPVLYPTGTLADPFARSETFSAPEQSATDTESTAANPTNTAIKSAPPEHRSTEPLRLAGTLKRYNSQHYTALVSNAQGEIISLVPGDKLAAGSVQVVRITADSLLLQEFLTGPEGQDITRLRQLDLVVRKDE